MKACIHTKTGTWTFTAALTKTGTKSNVHQHMNGYTNVENWNTILQQGELTTDHITWRDLKLYGMKEDTHMYILYDST